MAYNLSKRFPSPPTYYRILDPGAYQNVSNKITSVNNIPFLSRTPRRTQSENKLWTHAIYTNDIPAKIVNCTALKSKVPRFPYEVMTKEEFEKFLCQCGIQSSCECSTSEDVEEEHIACQGKVSRHIFKGPPPRAASEYNKQENIKKKTEPPFYDARVTESSSFYKGCKWSKWSSNRSSDKAFCGPGPAHYTLEREQSYAALCAEKVRSFKRKTSKQLRFIEMVQQRNLRENQPGPGSYDPKDSKGTDLSYLGPKAERFIARKYEIYPGPADHWLKRDFDNPDPPDKCCLAQLPSAAPFGIKAIRIKPRREEGPSPTSYDVKLGTCNFMRCSTAPFGVSSLRFKETIKDITEEEYDTEKEEKGNENSNDKRTCELPCWEFRSKTIRMKPLLKNLNEPSPADLPQPNVHISRSYQFQCIAPFFTSDERFRPWYNWIPMHGSEKTPGPCYYCLDKLTCLPAVRHGPLNRSPRFKHIKSQSPSPNKYHVGNGIEKVLDTYNERLKRNIEKKLKFRWKTLNTTRELTFEERENLLLTQSIQLLDTKV